MNCHDQESDDESEHFVRQCLDNHIDNADIVGMIIESWNSSKCVRRCSGCHKAVLEEETTELFPVGSITRWRLHGPYLHTHRGVVATLSSSISPSLLSSLNARSTAETILDLQGHDGHMYTKTRAPYVRIDNQLLVRNAGSYLRVARPYKCTRVSTKDRWTFVCISCCRLRRRAFHGLVSNVHVSVDSV